MPFWIVRTLISQIIIPTFAYMYHVTDELTEVPDGLGHPPIGALDGSRRESIIIFSLNILIFIFCPQSTLT